MSNDKNKREDKNNPLRNYKDSTFRLLFSEPKRAIELYNAVSGENLPPDTELTYTTLENAIYADRKNDIGFVINNRHLVLSECQSTVNNNMAMRCLGYVSRTLENLAGKDGLYGKETVKFPAPEFYVFYIGTEKWQSRHLKLSESFLAEPRENSIELVVNIVNLSYNESKEILKRSPSLLGYSKLVDYIRQGQKGGESLQEAIDAAVLKCIEEGLIEDFLRVHSREVSGMLFRELTMEEFAEIRAREAYGKGEQAGLERGRTEGLERGAAQEKHEIAREMLLGGMPLATISQFTKLPPEEIETLKNKGESAGNKR